MVIFHSYVSLPEGRETRHFIAFNGVKGAPSRWWNSLESILWGPQLLGYLTGEMIIPIVTGTIISPNIPNCHRWNPHLSWFDPVLMVKSPFFTMFHALIPPFSLILGAPGPWQQVKSTRLPGVTWRRSLTKSSYEWYADTYFQHHHIYIYIMIQYIRWYSIIYTVYYQ